MSKAPKYTFNFGIFRGYRKMEKDILICHNKACQYRTTYNECILRLFGCNKRENQLNKLSTKEIKKDEKINLERKGFGD